MHERFRALLEKLQGGLIFDNAGEFEDWMWAIREGGGCMHKEMPPKTYVAAIDGDTEMVIWFDKGGAYDGDDGKFNVEIHVGGEIVPGIVFVDDIDDETEKALADAWESALETDK